MNIKNSEFNKLSNYIKKTIGVNLTEKKKVLITARLSRILEQKGFKNYTEYYNYLISDVTGEAANELVNKITTNHTFFNRENDHFQYLKDEVLPDLILKEKVSKDLRIWSAGCSTGEEPYTIAMIISDYLGYERRNWDTKILATDISSKVLETAKNGIYDDEKIKSMSNMWKMNYMSKLKDDNSIMCNDIRKNVIFRRFNLMNGFKFKKKFHIIFCRNVMIYFDESTKMNLVNKFYDMLEPGGYLFIGHSESLNRNVTEFKYKRAAIYRKE